MGPIKNFSYLDEYKMYSLSSQIFEGITEYLIDYKSQHKEEQETQKGPVGSGQILADIIKQGTETQGKRFLHDYSYHIFEKHLCDQNKVLSIDVNSDRNVTQDIQSFPFVKVKSRALFNDITFVNNTLNNFNKFGEAITYVTNYQNIEGAKQQLQTAQASIKDKNQKAALQEKIKSLTNISKLAKEAGLRQDQSYLEALSFLFSYGYQDQLEAQFNIGELIFSANLKREALREPEALLIRKHSRMTEKEFVLFGTVTQSADIASKNSSTDTSSELPMNDETPEVLEKSLKEAIRDLVMSLYNIEKSYIGRLSNEVIVDPIALYVEL